MLGYNINGVLEEFTMKPGIYLEVECYSYVDEYTFIFVEEINGY